MPLSRFSPYLLIAMVSLTACRTAYVPSATDASGPGPIYRRGMTAGGGGWSAPGAVDSIVASLSLEEKVAQMIMVRAYGHYVSEESDPFRRLARLVGTRKIGGIIMAQGDVYEEAMLTNRLQQLAKIPLLVGADFERGVAMRVRRGTPFPDAMAVGAARQPELAYRMGLAIAEEARALGIHQNYAPVADINSNPLNPVINTRAFSDDPALVRAMVLAFIRGTMDGRCVATLKHFPGHGDTGSDSHLELPTLNLTRGRLDSVELSSFRAAIDSGVGSVMIAHLAIPALDSLGLPASLSHAMVDGLLRTTLGFKGLVVTDAMGMQAIARNFRPDTAALLAVKAGIDMILVSPDEDAAAQAIVRAVRNGEIREERINASVRRILRTKQWLGLDRRRFVDLDSIANTVANSAHRTLAKEMCREGVTLVRNTGGLVPLAVNGTGRIAAILISDNEENRTDVNRPGFPLTSEPYGQYLLQLLRRRAGNVESSRLTPSSTQAETDASLALVRKSDVALLCLFVKVRTSSGRIGLPDELRRFVDRVQETRTPLVICLFGTPYIATQFPAARAILCAYGDNEDQMEASAEALFGEIPLHGRLPVTVSGTMPIGTGIELPQSQLRRDDPAAAGFSPEDLAHVDDIVEHAIADSAFPGAQVAVIRGGMLIYNRSFGSLTYGAGAQPVDAATRYDCASLTKVVATTTAMMRLYDLKKYNLDDPVGVYLPEFSRNEKSTVTIRHLLLHRAGFPPFRQLWKICPDAHSAIDSALATPLVAKPGDSTIYSDLGMIALGKLVEKFSGMPLDSFVRREIFDPLHMCHTGFRPDTTVRERIAPTELDTAWRKRLVQGSVHDENAALLGGVAGHAGLFSTASDLAVFMQMLLNRGVYGGRRYISEGTIYEFLARKAPGQERWLGWDMWSMSGSSGGTLLSPSSYGHTGFTGTSLWADPARNLAVVFLTNRVYPTRANLRLLRIRPALHDAVIHALQSAGPGE
jgi:beta-N-acetylhexosaminidase